MAHRLSGSPSEAAPFATAMLERINDLKNRAPFLDLSAEEKYFKELMYNKKS